MNGKDYPEFCPSLTDCDGIYRYEDGRVSGMVDVSSGSIAIYEWNSAFEGQGHTRIALAWFRKSGAGTITVINMGMPPEDNQEPDPYVMYWLHLRDEGLVDVLIDDNNQPFDDAFYTMKKSHAIDVELRKPKHTESEAGVISEL
jgi:hypothetical protein